MHLDLKQIEALAAVLRTGSFEAAARDLNLTASALSQRVKMLEERVGSVLVVRAPRCSPTAHGRLIWHYAQEVAFREQGLLGHLGLEAGVGPLPVSIAVTPDTMATWFLEALRDIPQLLFQLEIDNAEQGGRLLAQGKVHAAVTFGQKVVQGCDAIKLGSLHYMPVCSPAFFGRWFGAGLTADALARAPALAYNRHDRLQIDFATRVIGVVTHPPTHYFEDARALAEAAELGLGWVLLPHPLCQTLLDEGRLVLMSQDNHVFSELTWQVARATRDILKPVTKGVRAAASRRLVQHP